jgi:4-hydroxy-3-methylbut-2-enyl diphosphate reductase
MYSSSHTKDESPLHVEIDSKSGFCFGVVRAISQAEEVLKNKGTIYSLGDIVHNDLEVGRLSKEGMKTIVHGDLEKIQEGTVFFRAHGEPPESYQRIREKGLNLIDATCPVVLKLQQRVRAAYEDMKEKNGQVAIFGKMGHAEVKGLSGQTNHEAVILEKEEDVRLIDPGRPIILFSQTTKSPVIFNDIAQAIRRRALAGVEVQINDTICRQVSNRAPHLQDFSRKHDIIIFVGGAKSSNARSLFEACIAINPRTHFISSPEDLQKMWFEPRPKNIGVCGATSTPAWLMEIVAERIRTF